MGINFVDEQAPDATTLLKFRHMMEESKIGEQLFHAINYVIEKSGYMMRGGTIVDGYHHQRLTVHQKRGKSQGSGDAPDEEGQ